MMTGFDVVTDTHLRLQAAHARAIRIIAWTFAPLLLGGSALTAWTAVPATAAPIAPVLLMCCLVFIGINLGWMLSALQDARAAARTLAAAHNATTTVVSGAGHPAGHAEHAGHGMRRTFKPAVRITARFAVRRR